MAKGTPPNGVNFTVLSTLGVPGIPQTYTAKTEATEVGDFRFYSTLDGQLLKTVGGALRTMDISSLLGEGVWATHMTHVDFYSNESLPSPITAEYNGAGVAEEVMRLIETVNATRLVSGNILVKWVVEPARIDLAEPTEFQVALATDLSTILFTLPYVGLFYEQQIGPYTNGQTVAVVVRTHDGAGDYGDWVAAPLVVVDSVGPEAPTLV